MWTATLAGVSDPNDKGIVLADVIYSDGASKYQLQYEIDTASKTQIEDLISFAQIELKTVTDKVKLTSQLNAIVGKVLASS